MPSWRPQATWQGRKRECYDCLKKEVLNSRCLLARCDDGDLLAAAAAKAFQWYKGHNTHSHTYYSHMVARLKRPPRPRRSNTNQMQKLLIAHTWKKHRKDNFIITFIVTGEGGEKILEKVSGVLVREWTQNENPYCNQIIQTVSPYDIS